VLTAKVMRLVNSGFYGFRSPITTVTQAMVLLGFDVVKTLVLAASVLDVLELMNKLLSGLWEHSLATARLANVLAERVRLSNPEEVAVSGLLHDFGKVIVAQRFPDEFREIRRTVEARDCALAEAEREVLGVEHAEVGMWLLKKWGLPAKLVYPIAYHNQFSATREFADRTAVIHVANVMARARGYGNPGDHRVPAINRDAWGLLQLTTKGVEEVFLQLEGELSETLAG
jgi:putative nucleotidyltransferase with HDIG domain